MKIEDQILELEARFQKELKDLKDSLANETPTFEKDKWYYYLGAPLGFDTTFWKEGLVLNHRGTKCGSNPEFWKMNMVETCSNLPKAFRPATKEEIQSALIAEATRRGFKEGVRINSLVVNDCIIWSSRCTYFDITSESLNGKDSLYMDGRLIYDEGKWAEIIQEEPLKIAGELVTYPEKSHPLANRVCGIGGDYYTEHELQELNALLLSHSKQIKSLNVGCSGQYKVSQEDIQKLLNGFKK